jgi:hypothetical protein
MRKIKLICFWWNQKNTTSTKSGKHYEHKKKMILHQLVKQRDCPGEAMQPTNSDNRTPE